MLIAQSLVPHMHALIAEKPKGKEAEGRQKSQSSHASQRQGRPMGQSEDHTAPSGVQVQPSANDRTGVVEEARPKGDTTDLSASLRECARPILKD